MGAIVFLTKRADGHSAIILRIALAFVFAYAAIDGMREPVAWFGYLPHFLTVHSSEWAVLRAAEASEILLAVWLLLGVYVRIAALAAAALLLGIVATNPHALIVTFRDVGLLLAAIALVFEKT